jgi:hypothetical protein
VTITASKAARLRRCPGSAALRQIESTNEYAERGTVGHAFLEALRRDDDREGALAKVPEEYRALCESIDVDKLPRNLEPELALAYDVANETTRRLGSGIGRNYGELGPFEIAMTLDLGGCDGSVAHVLDYKLTMRSPGPAAGHDQLRICALALARLHGVTQARTELAHIKPDGSVWIDRDDLDAFDLDDIAADLKRLHATVAEEKLKAKLGEPLTLAMGSHCDWCPSRPVCPAQSRLAIELAEGRVMGDPLTMLPLSPERAGVAYTRIKAARSLLAHMERAVMAALEEAGGALPLPDGRLLVKQLAPGNERLDGTAAAKLIAEMFGAEALNECAEIKVTKTSLRAGLRKLHGRNGASQERAFLKALRDAGGVSRKPSERLVEVDPAKKELA